MIVNRIRDMPQVTRGAKVERKCQSCRLTFFPRKADVDRGWGKFCSKSCKAIKQEQRTGQYARFQNRKEGYPRWDD